MLLFVVLLQSQTIQQIMFTTGIAERIKRPTHLPTVTGFDVLS